MSRESDGVISLTLCDLERSYLGQLLKNRVSVRDSAIITKEHQYKVMSRESVGVIKLTLCDLERSYLGQLLKNRVSVRDSAIVTIEH